MKKRDSGLFRKIYFYRLEHHETIVDILPSELARVANLPFNNDGRYLVDADGDRLTLWADSLEFPLKLRFGRTRLSQLPTKELRGKLTPLEIEDDAGLAEICHVIIYPDGYVAAEFNFDGPRLQRLGEYLFAKRNRLSERPIFRPLFQRDILKLVAAMPTIRWLDLKGGSDAADLLQDADRSLAAAYKTLTTLGANKSVEMVLSAEQRPGSRLQKLCTSLAELVAQRPGESRNALKKLTIKGFTTDGRINEVDMLEDHLIVGKLFERESKKSKAVSSEAAYRVIDEAYNERKDELAAATIGRFLR